MQSCLSKKNQTGAQEVRHLLFPRDGLSEALQNKSDSKNFFQCRRKKKPQAGTKSPEKIISLNWNIKKRFKSAIQFSNWIKKVQVLVTLDLTVMASWQ